MAALLRFLSAAWLVSHIAGALPFRRAFSKRIQAYSRRTLHAQISQRQLSLQSLAVTRGGASYSDDEYEDDDEETSMEVSMDFTMDSLVDVGKKVLSQTAQVASWIFKAVARSVEAGLDETEEEADLPTVARLTKALQRMMQGLFSSSSSSRKEESLLEEKAKVSTKKSQKKVKSSKMGSSKSKTKKSKKAKKTSASPETVHASSSSNDDAETSDDTSSAPVLEEEETSESVNEEDEQSTETTSSAADVDFGTYLEKAYNVPTSSRNQLEEPCTVHSGSFSEALSQTQSEARLLLVLIPSEKPSIGSSTDASAIASLLSQEVALMADKKALKGGLKMGSFYLWSALPGSTEALQALKRLKLSLKNPQGTKRPVLAAVYVGVDSRGRLVPKLLAQHHAMPPPPPETMAAWMNALRKRHKAQYTKMQTNVRELELYKERQEGYQSSMVQDTENRQKEAELAAEAKRKAEEEAKHQAEIEERRTRLEEELGEEVSKDTPNSKVLSIRMDSGESHRRRFPHDATIEMVLNWADVQCQVEREKVVLTALNGKQSFSWGDRRDATLEEVGLGKMTGFRLGFAKAAAQEPEEPETS